MRSLGLDIGDKRIGVALSDPQGILASPLTIITCRDRTADIEAITDIIRQNQVVRVIVGLPRSMNGSLGRQAEKVKDFVRSLSGQIKIPVEFRDERLSSVSARRLIRDTRQKRAGHDDAIAAALVLQMYLDEKHLAGYH
jgi:putative Holliday junction resolvase